MGTFSRPVQWLLDALGVSDSSNVNVSASTALNNAPIWFGINKISGDLGTMPLHLMRKDGSTRERVTGHPAYNLLRNMPNFYQDAIVFKQCLTQHSILWGNGRAYVRRERGRPVELIPIMPDRTITGIVIDDDGNAGKWHCTYPSMDSNCALGGVDTIIAAMQENRKRTVTISDQDVLHIQGFGNGCYGMSLFEVARTSLEISLGADKRAARQMQRGYAGKVMLQAPENSPYFRDQLKANEFLEDFKRKHGANADGEEIGLLREGVTMNVQNTSNRDSEFIAQREFQREEAALWLGLENMPGIDNSVSFNSLEQKNLSYWASCLKPWITRWEQQCNSKLLTEAERNMGYYFKFNVADLLRTDFATTVSTLCQGLTHQLWNFNEAREKLDMNPRDGGDQFFNPNITPGPSSTATTDDTMAARLRHMLNIEEKRVAKFIERGDSYEHIDTWYSSFCDKLGQVVEELGGDWQTAQNHCVRSLSYLKGKPETFDLTGSEELIIKEIKER